LGISRHPEHWPKRGFVLLWRDGERRGKCNFTLTCERLKLTHAVDLSSFTDIPHVQFLLKTPHQKRDASYFRRTRLSERVLSVPFPEAPPELISPDIRQVVYNHLPPYEDSRGACELFLNYSSYMYVALVPVNISLILTDGLRRASSLTREEMLRVLETVYQNK
jgi:hypothetical protein